MTVKPCGIRKSYKKNPEILAIFNTEIKVLVLILFVMSQIDALKQNQSLSKPKILICTREKKLTKIKTSTINIKYSQAVFAKCSQQ